MVSNKPFAQGEIVLGSDAIAAGYLDNPEESEQAFFEKDGMRWWRSGDIAEVDERGVFRIVDRKKDIIKMQFGEYVSLGKIEAGLKVHPLVDNVCAYGDMFKDSLIALVQPNENELRSLAKRLGLGEDISWENLCSNATLAKAVQEELAIFARTSSGGGLIGREIPAGVFLCKDNWIATGMITAALKIRRKAIYDRYVDEIKSCYKGLK